MHIRTMTAAAALLMAGNLTAGAAFAQADCGDMHMVLSTSGQPDSSDANEGEHGFPQNVHIAAMGSDATGWDVSGSFYFGCPLTGIRGPQEICQGGGETHAMLLVESLYGGPVGSCDGGVFEFVIDAQVVNSNSAAPWLAVGEWIRALVVLEFDGDGRQTVRPLAWIWGQPGAPCAPEDDSCAFAWGPFDEGPMMFNLRY